MKIAVASGKGGTGKTTVAVNLALAASVKGHKTAYLDCDVEEPNGALFLKPEFENESDVTVAVPQSDMSKCTGCGQCGKICQYNAIAALGKKVLIFQELCHGCGGCWLVCPEGALSESSRVTGKLQGGHAQEIMFMQGLLNVGEPMSPPVIRTLKKQIPEAEITIIDSPPGTSCPVIESVKDADYVLLVTEPTPFGLNDLKLAVDMVQALKLPFSVIINRADSGDSQTADYCRDNRINIIGEIPDDRKVAEAYSKGETAFHSVPGYAKIFYELLENIELVVGRSAVI